MSAAEGPSELLPAADGADDAAAAASASDCASASSSVSTVGGAASESWRGRLRACGACEPRIWTAAASFTWVSSTSSSLEGGFPGLHSRNTISSSDSGDVVVPVDDDAAAAAGGRGLESDNISMSSMLTGAGAGVLTVWAILRGMPGLG